MVLESQGVCFEVEEPLLSDSWVEVGEVTSFTLYDGEASQIDSTHLKSTRREFFMGLPDEGTVTLSVQFSPTDSSHALLRARRNTRTKSRMRVTWTDTAGTREVFEFYCLRVTPRGQVDEKVEADVTIRITGEVQPYV